MSNERIYHEKQRRQLCALHALNNLFQSRDAFSKEALDNICYELNSNYLLNPHKSGLGLGNYDIAVIEKALETKQFCYKWFNRNKNFSDLRLENIFGFILNIPNVAPLWKAILTLGQVASRHWIAVRKIGDSYWNLDSKLPKPQQIANIEKFILERISDDSQVLIVISNEVDELGSWKTANYG